MKAKMTLEDFQNLNTLTEEQRIQFEILLEEELSKPENKKIMDEIVEKINNKESFKH